MYLALVLKQQQPIKLRMFRAHKENSKMIFFLVFLANKRGNEEYSVYSLS